MPPRHDLSVLTKHNTSFSLFIPSRQCAADLSAQVGNYHLNVDITSCFDAIVALFAAATGKTPKFRAHGGTNAENLALQNIQARFRMLFSYMLAQLLPWVRGRRGGFLLVLGSSNARFFFLFLFAHTQLHTCTQ